MRFLPYIRTPIREIFVHRYVCTQINRNSAYVLSLIYLIQITCLEVILIATIKMHDEWEGLARILADLITKYADVLEDQDKPNLSNEEEQQDAA